MYPNENPEPLEAAAAEGVHRIALPTPFMVGRINTYLIQDDPLTLIDTGPNSGKALDELEQGLGHLGHAIEDIGLVVLTHQHMDHVGLAEVTVRRSGAEVAALAALAPYMEHFANSFDLDNRFAARLMRRHGVADEVVSVLQALGTAMRAWGSNAHVTQPLADGATLRLRDRTFEIHHRPGHSPSDTVLHDPQRRMLFAGDHLLRHVSSNPLITRPLDAGDSQDAPRPQALKAYLNSLRATREMDLDLVLGGHGETITDQVAVIDERFQLQERRTRKILKLIAQRPCTAYELACELWGAAALSQAYLTISEVLGALDLLVDDGRAQEVEQDGLAHFEAL